IFVLAASALMLLALWAIGALVGAGPFLHPRFFWVIPVGFFVSMGLLFRIGRAVRRAATPLGDLMEAANRVASGDFSARVDEQGPPEVRQLTRAFNAMSARLEATEQQRRSFLAEVTHELRTPLTVVRGNLEGMLDGVYAADDARLTATLDETRLLGTLI